MHDRGYVRVRGYVHDHDYVHDHNKNNVHKNLLNKYGKSVPQSYAPGPSTPRLERGPAASESDTAGLFG